MLLCRIVELFISKCTTYEVNVRVVRFSMKFRSSRSFLLKKLVVILHYLRIGKPMKLQRPNEANRMANSSNRGNQLCLKG